MPNILIVGSPFSPIFELGERLSSFHDVDLWTIEADNEAESYFSDKIKSIPFDTGDMTSGSDQQQMSPDRSSYRKQKEMDSLEAPTPMHCLSLEEQDMLDMAQGFLVSEVLDPQLAQWSDCVIWLYSDVDKALAWLTKRRKCPSCGSVYHMKDLPPKAYPLCDRCGTNIIRQSKDSPEYIKRVYNLWRKHSHSIEKVIEFTKKPLIKIDISETDSFDKMVNEIDCKLKKILNLEDVVWSYNLQDMQRRFGEDSGPIQPQENALPAQYPLEDGI